MAQQGQSSPQLLINNVAIQFVPNSLKYDTGNGEQDVVSQSGGGGTTETVYFDNDETKVGMVSFEMYTTVLALISHTDWKALGNANVIEYIDSGSNLSMVFQNAAQTNKSEFEVGDKKVVPFEFKSDPAITNV